MRDQPLKHMRPRDQWPTQEQLKRLFDYHGDGHLIWRESRGRAKRGARAGSVQIDGSGRGRMVVRVDYKMWALSLLVWLWHGREVPPGKLIDHKNENQFDNRIENLEPLTSSENLGKSAKSKCYCYDKKSGKYRPYIRKNYIKHHFGYWADERDAKAVAAWFRWVAFGVEPGAARYWLAARGIERAGRYDLNFVKS